MINDPLIREMTCIRCPLGCRMTIALTESGLVKSVTGNTCPKGDAYAREEIQDPRRILTTSLKVLNGRWELVSVKTAGSIPKKLVLEAQEYLKPMEINAPVEAGQILLENLLGTGVPVVATRSVEKI